MVRRWRVKLSDLILTACFVVILIITYPFIFNNKDDDDL